MYIFKELGKIESKMGDSKNMEGGGGFDTYIDIGSR